MKEDLVIIVQIQYIKMQRAVFLQIKFHINYIIIC